MSATTKALELVKLLKPKIGEQAATKLIDYADKRKDKSIDRLWIALIGGFTIIISILFYLHNDVKSDMRAMEERILKAIEKNTNSY